MTLTETNIDIDTLVSTEPKLQAITNPLLRNFIASDMLVNGSTFEDAEKKALDLLMGAQKTIGEYQDKIKARRDKVAEDFKSSVRDAVYSAANKIGETDRPEAGWNIVVFYNTQLKNSDGSPVMENGQPKLGTIVEINPRWEVKRSSTASSTGGTGRQGRPEGYILTPDGQKYNSLKVAGREYAAKHNLNWDNAKPSREAFDALGIVVPPTASPDSEGKPHFALSLKPGVTHAPKAA